MSVFNLSALTFSHLVEQIMSLNDTDHALTFSYRGDGCISLSGMTRGVTFDFF